MPVLKPCPFCGGEATLFKEKANATGTRFVYWVSCAFKGEIDCNCIPKTCNFENEIEAINAWNNRYTENDNE